MKLSIEQAEAILAVENGADVYGYGLAKALRELQRAKPRAHKKFFEITQAMQPPDDVKEKQPYFGAIATKAGIAAAKKILKSKSRQ